MFLVAQRLLIPPFLPIVIRQQVVQRGRRIHVGIELHSRGVMEHRRLHLVQGGHRRRHVVMSLRVLRIRLKDPGQMRQGFFGLARQEQRFAEVEVHPLRCILLVQTGWHLL